MTLVPEINNGGLSIQLVLRNTLMALEVAQRGVAIELGREMLSGSAVELATDRSLAEACLGADHRPVGLG